MQPIPLALDLVAQLAPWAWLSLLIALLGAAWIRLDLRRRPPPMAVMRWVWPLAALWGSAFGIALYLVAGRGPPPAQPMAAMADMDMKSMGGGSMAMASSRPFPLRVAAGTAHCGAGCAVADLVGGWLFYLAPWVIAGSAVLGEWTGEYLLALVFGVGFQYAAIQPMLHLPPLQAVARAFKVDVFSLSAWQLGMYGFMALVLFVWLGRIPPSNPVFWFAMQGAMIAGFFCSYLVNWWLIRSGVKPAM